MVVMIDGKISTSKRDKHELRTICTDLYYKGFYEGTGASLDLDDVEISKAEATLQARERRITLEAQKVALMDVRLRPGPYTDRGDADKYIVMKLDAINTELDLATHHGQENE